MKSKTIFLFHKKSYVHDLLQKYESKNVLHIEECATEGGDSDADIDRRNILTTNLLCKDVN